MKTISSLILSFYFCTSSFGQIDFKADTSSNNTNNVIYHLIDSTFKLDNSFDFQLRFWTFPSLEDYTSIFILSKKNNHWTARFFEFRKLVINKITEISVNQNKLDGLWEKLNKNQILTLPNQWDLRDKFVKFSSDTTEALYSEGNERRIAMTDGVQYIFELSTQIKKRSYSYHCPKSYLTHFANVEELYRAFVLIILIRKYLGLNLSVC
jgi:hypothetical protein